MNTWKHSISFCCGGTLLFCGHMYYMFCWVLLLVVFASGRGQYVLFYVIVFV